MVVFAITALPVVLGLVSSIANSFLNLNKFLRKSIVEVVINYSFL